MRLAGRSAEAAHANLVRTPPRYVDARAPARSITANPSRNAASSNAVAEFLAYAKETPAQQMRDSILHQLGLTEDDLKAMSPKDRAKVEQKIADLVKQKGQINRLKKKTGVIVDLKA